MPVDEIKRLAESNSEADWRKAVALFLDEHPRFMAAIGNTIRDLVVNPSWDGVKTEDLYADDLFMRCYDHVVQRVLVPASFCRNVQKYEPNRALPRTGGTNSRDQRPFPIRLFLMRRVRWAIGEVLKKEPGRENVANVDTRDQPNAFVDTKMSQQGDHRESDSFVNCLWRYFEELESRQRAVLMLLHWQADTLPRAYRHRALSDIFAVAHKSGRSCKTLRGAWRDLPTPVADTRLSRRGKFFEKLAQANQQRQYKQLQLEKVRAGHEPGTPAFQTLMESLRAQCRQVIRQENLDAAMAVFVVDGTDAISMAHQRFLKACYREKMFLTMAQNAYDAWMRARPDHLLKQDLLANILGMPIGTVESDLNRAKKRLRELAEGQADAGRVLPNIFPERGRTYAISSLFEAETELDVDSWIRHRVCQLE